MQPTLLVYTGLEKLAKLFDKEMKLNTDIDSSDLYTIITKSFELDGVAIESRDYIKKGGSKDV